jgi:hypothetical protein
MGLSLLYLTELGHGQVLPFVGFTWLVYAWSKAMPAVVGLTALLSLCSAKFQASSTQLSSV